jgi:class 3 adenylate cyclase/tetratricopeptide (TPR) repeat protein
MNDTPERIAATIAALEAQRGLLGDVVVDTALAPLRHALAALQNATAQQLKQVSVLFVDVVGSTAIGQKLAPEDIHTVMDGALERFTSIVESRGGRVLQYTGDGMLAAFGTDASLEDDAESAVLAGLGILAEAKAMAPRVRREHGIPDFDVRAGIHTGTVLLGGGVDAEGSIRGSVVNVAARMEQSAPAGGLRISLATYRQVLGALDCEEQAPIAVKGVEAPVRSYLVRGVRPRAQRESGRGLGGVRTPLIGRDRELGRLHAAFRVAAEGGRLQAVTIVGEAGLGKTRLLAEFRAELARESRAVHLLLGQAHPRSALQPYGMLRDLLLRQLDIADTDSADDARSRFVAGLAPLLGEAGEAPAHLVGHLIGLDFSGSPHIGPLLGDAQRIRDQAFAVVGQLVRGLARGTGRPVVLEVLDDLHWADGGSLACARYLLQSNRDTPLLLLFLTRPELFEQHPDWADADPLHQRLDLAPLDRDDSIRLAETLLQRIEQVPEALRALITTGAEGNPFYMEELVKMLLDDGVIVADAAGWRVQADRLLRASVPPTLTGVLQARLGALGRAERSALQHAAVIGQVFSDQSLAALDAAAPAALPALLHKQLIVRRDGSGSDGGQEYAFKHNLLHQVAYDSVLKGPKRAGHRAMGSYWSARAEVQSPQAVTPASCRALAEVHYHRCIADLPEYVGWFDTQFYNYLNAYAGPTLRPLAEGLIGLCETQFGADHAETAKALTNLARVCVQQGDVARAEPLLRRAIAIQQVAPGPDHPDTARTVAVLGGLYVGRGDHRAAEPEFRRALAIRERALGPEHALTVGTLDLLASTVGELGRNDEAELLSRRVLEIRERLLGPDHPDTLFALTALGDVLSKKQDHAAAEPLIRRALTAQQRTLPAEHPNTGLSMWNLAEALRGLGRLAEAEPLARGSLAMWEKTLGPQHEWTAWSLGSLARLRLDQGDAADAEVLARRALEIHERALGSEHATVAETLVLLGQALLARGERALARPLLERALMIQSTRPDAEEAIRRTRALLTRARVRARRG